MISKIDEPAILVVDDDPDICEFIADAAESVGVHADTASDYPTFLQLFRSREHAAILLDLQMPDKDGLEYLRLLSESGCAARVVLMSGYDDRVLKTAQRVGQSQGLAMLPSMSKPMPLDDLKARLSELAARRGQLVREDLERALAGGELVLEYQPKVRLASTESRNTRRTMLNTASGEWDLDSLEALVRWNHPTLGRLPPDSFIPQAEQWDLIRPLTEVVIAQALQQLNAWDAISVVATVAINYPPQMLTDITAPDRLADQVRDAGLSPDRLIVEITESAAMTNIARSMDVLTRLRLKGFRLAMDDFGTGYSSLVQLHRMPFTELKIDKSIVLEMDTESEARTIVRTIVDLAHNLDLEVCAEGAENEHIVDGLRDFGCDVAQGYLISRPVGSDAVAGLLSRNTSGNAAGR